MEENITTISIQYTYTKNIGNFESEKLTASVARELDPGEKQEDAFQKEFLNCRQFVWKSLNLVYETDEKTEVQIQERLQERGTRRRRRT